MPESNERTSEAAESPRAEGGTAKIVFMPSGRRGEFPNGTPVLKAARSLGVDIDSVCGGVGICSRCRIRLSTGTFSKLGIVSLEDHLSPPGEVEAKHRAEKGLPEDQRLSCAAKLLGDVVIDVPPESQIHKQMVRKRPDSLEVALDPVIRLHYVEMPKPSMDDQTPDLLRLKQTLERDWNLAAGELTAELHVLRQISEACRGGDAYGGDWRVTVAVREDKHITAIWPDFHDKVYGFAVDIGTTTIAAHLCDLQTGEVVASQGEMNPQIRYGEDLMSRVSYLQMNEGSAPVLTNSVREAMQRIIGACLNESGVDKNDVLEFTFVGNPIMHHLFLGIDPTQLGIAPFPLVVDDSVTVKATELDLDVNLGAHAYFLPCILGHVGADSAGVILSEAPHKRDELTLIVDVGTNAEIVLGSKNRLIACSSPTGPAFEGAQVSSGQRAAPGAIERVRIDRETLAPRFRVIGCETWSDEPTFEDDLKKAGLSVTGICGSGIIEALAEMRINGILAPGGLIDGGPLEDNPYVIKTARTYDYLLWPGPPEIRVTQGDVRAIQLAKSACYSGAQLLMDEMGVDTVDRIVLAGAFGSYIDTKYAMVLGMIPDCELDKVNSAGNAAGTGARIALLNKASRREIEQTVKLVEKVETATHPSFQEYFVAAMDIPHATHAFPHLSKVVTFTPPRPGSRAEKAARAAKTIAERKMEATPAKAGAGPGPAAGSRPGSEGRAAPAKKGKKAAAAGKAKKAGA